MYYILNENNQIIAADESLLALCGVKDIQALNKEIVLDSIRFNSSNNQSLQLQTQQTTRNYATNEIPLSTLLGTLTLIQVNQELREEPSMDLSKNEALKDDFSDIEHLLITKDENHAPTIIDTFESYEAPILDDPTPIDKKPIYIDIEKISQDIGVSKDDFNLFLDEYITTAIDLEKELQSQDNALRSHAVTTLSHLSEVLHLESIGQIIKEIEQSDVQDRTSHVSALYDALSRITVLDTHKSIPSTKNVEETPAVHFDLDEPLEIKPSKEALSIPKERLNLDLQSPTPSSEIKKETFIGEKFDLDLDLPLHDFPTTPKEEVVKHKDKFDLDLNLDSQPLESKADSKNEIPHTLATDIDLSHIQPIHFDFSIKTAAQELSLPENLIEEFMVDFVEQSHSETALMIEAYSKGDLSSIQKIGHLLKGVSSNLRIMPLSDTLYKIQFCNKLEDFEPLIKDYWAHFLSFEKQINAQKN